MRRAGLLASISASLLFTARANALHLAWPDSPAPVTRAIVSLDLDDDNDDGVPDALETPAPSAATDNDVVVVTVHDAGNAAIRVGCTGTLRLVTPAGLRNEIVLGPASRSQTLTFGIVGVAVSAHDGDATLTVSTPAGSSTVAITVVSVGFLSGTNGLLWGHRSALGISHEITNNLTLPRGNNWSERSADPDNTRVEIWDPGAEAAARVRVESSGTAASPGVAPGVLRGVLSDMPLDRGGNSARPLRSRFVRLVGDELDLRAPGLLGQTLLVGLRDRVRARYRRTGVAGEASTDLRVGRPGNEDGPLAARIARWRLTVLRDRPGGRPVIGSDEASAARIAREQVVIANEIYLQCSMTFGDPASYAVQIADPPSSTLLSVSDDDGLSALGGVIHLRADGRALEPVRAERGWLPVRTAEAIARALRAAGFTTRVLQNRRVDYGAAGSADVMAWTGTRLVRLAAPTTGPISTDPQQSISIGEVDLSDGIEEFNNLNSAAGTLEERTLVHGLADNDPATIDVFVINRFAHRTRIGEAFVEGDSGAIINALVLDRHGLEAQREAWTQAHEVGHVFLDQPWHPDNMGPDRPWLLMDADAGLAAVTGPKRLEPDECRRIMDQSGPRTAPTLVGRYDLANPSPRAREFVQWPDRDPYPR